MSLDDAMAVEVVGILPGVKQEVWIAWSYRPLFIRFDVMFLFEPANDFADVAISQSGLTGQVGLGLEPLGMKQELTCDPGARFSVGGLITSLKYAT